MKCSKDLRYIMNIGGVSILLTPPMFYTGYLELLNVFIL